MARARLLLAAACLVLLGMGRSAHAEGWLVANKCRLEDCYLKWVTEIVRRDADVFRVTIVTVDWKGIDDPPVYEEPKTSAYSVSCKLDQSFIEDEGGQRLLLPTENAGDDDRVAIWNGVCGKGRETLN